MWVMFVCVSLWKKEVTMARQMICLLVLSLSLFVPFAGAQSTEKDLNVHVP